MDKIQKPAQDLFGKALTPIDTFEAGGLVFTPTYLHAAVVVFLIFLLILTMARLRRLFVKWSLGKSATAMFFWGFMLALIIEGVLLIGGRTVLTEILGWENVPKPIVNVLDAGREKLVKVLGVSQEIPESAAEKTVTVEDLVGGYQSLLPEKQEEFKKILCTP